ncbi:hypothetical protein GN956_G18579 [Arapaima gigas]
MRVPGHASQGANPGVSPPGSRGKAKGRTGGGWQLLTGKCQRTRVHSRRRCQLEDAGNVCRCSTCRQGRAVRWRRAAYLRAPADGRVNGRSMGPTDRD